MLLTLSSAVEEPEPADDRPRDANDRPRDAVEEQAVALPEPSPPPDAAVAINAAELVARVLPRGLRRVTGTSPVVPSLDDAVSPTERSGWALRFDDGETEIVDAVLVLGRSPRHRPTDPPQTTRLITVDSAKASTNHLEVRVLDDQIVITDLESRTGNRHGDLR